MLVLPIIVINVGVPLIVVLGLYVWWTWRERNRGILIGYLASVTQRGYPLSGALSALADATSGAFSYALRDVATALESGVPLSEALARRPGLLAGDYLEMVQAGEAAGRLGEVFRVLRRCGRLTYRQRARMFAVAVYPLMLLVFTGITLMLHCTIILPKFQDVAKSFGTKFPPLVLHVARAWPMLFLFLLLVAGVLVIFAAPGSAAARREHRTGIRDTLKWWLPLARTHEKYEAVRLFAQSLQVRLRGGLPFRESLREACRTPVNGYAQKRLATMEADIERGEPLSTAASRCRLFPSRFVQLLAVGESGGDILPALEEITSRSLDTCERILNWTASVVFPAAVILLGIAVATVGVMIFGLLTNIMGATQGGAT